MMMNSPMSSLLVLFYLFSSLIFSANSNSITLSLTPTALPQSSSTNINNLRQRLNYPSAAASSPSTATAVSLFARGYGAYTLILGFGTPSQPLKFVLHTGTDLVWLPCTLGNTYLCNSCISSGDVDPKKIPTFKPNLSSSSKNISCQNPQCKWIIPDYHCSNNSELCPGYTIQYDVGNTTGRLLSESLTFPEGISVDNFLVGCSVSSAQLPIDGIAGFGRGPASLPSLLGLTSFSYCMVSHKFDDNSSVSSDLVLNRGSAAVGKGGGAIQYTPLGKNLKAFVNYYYLSLQKIYVGGVDVNVSSEYLMPNAEGNRGTVVDSGSTLTFMEKPVFELVAQEFAKQLGKLGYNRSTKFEKFEDLGLCFDHHVPVKKKSAIPQLSFHFEGDAIMDLPLENYILFPSSSVICMAMVTNNEGGVGVGPAIILGNYQQQNLYMEFDLENNRLGFQKQVCK